MEEERQPISLETIRQNIRNGRGLSQREKQFLNAAKIEELFEIVVLLSNCMAVLEQNILEILLAPQE